MSRSVRALSPIALLGKTADTVAPLDFPSVYERWFHPAQRWLRAMGVPDSELDDVAQEVFVVVQRQWSRFDGQNLPAWLYRICKNTASDQRRRAWFRRIFSRPRDVEVDSFAHGGDSPAELLERKEERQQLHALLARMSAKRRTAFALFEIEGLSGEEIAALEIVPVATIWTRLHHARKEFLALVGELREKERR